MVRKRCVDGSRPRRFQRSATFFRRGLTIRTYHDDPQGLAGCESGAVALQCVGEPSARQIYQNYEFAAETRWREATA